MVTVQWCSAVVDVTDGYCAVMQCSGGHDGRGLIEARIEGWPVTGCARTPAVNIIAQITDK